MGLTSLLARLAGARLHVLLVEPPGHLPTRVAAERAVADRGWVLAATPAEADVLLLLGTPGPELRAAADRLHDAMPGPRARIDAATPAEIAGALDTAARMLSDGPAQRTDAQERSAAPTDQRRRRRGDGAGWDPARRWRRRP